jgi:hypothetical protein
LDLLVNVDVDDLLWFAGRAAGRFVRVETLGASSAIDLLLKPDRTRPSAEANDLRGYRRHWTSIDHDFVVLHLGAAVAREIDVGATMKGEIRMHNWDRVAQTANPFAHRMCVLQFLGAGDDEIADRGENVPTSD